MTIATAVHRCRFAAPGFTIVELIAAMAGALMMVLIVTILFYSGQRSWVTTFDAANSTVELDAIETMTVLGIVGRKSNRADYRFYRVVADRFEPVIPSEPEEVVWGQAVELRYWDTELDASLMDVSKTATAYVLLYLEGDELKADYGPCPPGAVNASGIKLAGSDVTTVVLARNVASAEFSHTTRNLAGDGKGCIRLKMTLNDPTNDSTTTVAGAVLMRNMWP